MPTHKKVLSVIAGALAAGVLSTTTVVHAQNMCVYDPTSGNYADILKEYQLAATQWDTKLTYTNYTDERQATRDYDAGKCDAMMITGIRAREYNSFVGSIDSIGAINNYELLTASIRLFSDARLKSEMAQKGNEVGGIVPFGLVYLFANDRKRNTLGKMAGGKMISLNYDKAQPYIIKKIGVKPISADVSTMASIFNTGKADFLAAPLIAYKAFELKKGLGENGGVADYPIMSINANVIFKQSKFNATFGQQSRDWFVRNLNTTLKVFKQSEQDIPSDMWVKISPEDKVGYTRILREVRIDLIKNGIYNRKALHLIKLLRCKQDKSSFECPLNDE